MIPRKALGGRTPNEVYFGTGEDWPERLTAARAEARERRLELNRAASCPTCPADKPPPTKTRSGP